MVAAEGDVCAEFWEACAAGSVSVVTAMLAAVRDKRALLETVNEDGFDAMVIAAVRGQLGVVVALLEHGASIGNDTIGEYTALLAAAETGNADIVRLVVEHGADVNRQNVEGMTALMLAIEGQRESDHQCVDEGRVEIVKLLMRCGADPMQPNREGNTAMVMACATGDVAIVAAIVETIVSKFGPGSERPLLMIPRADGTTPILEAVDNGHVDVAVYLLRRRCVAFHPASEIELSLLEAAEVGDVDTVVLQLLHTQCGGQHIQPGFVEITASLIAASKGHLQVVRVLIEGGVVPTVATSERVSSLHLAAGFGHASVVQLLLRHGAGTILQTSKGATALLVASRQGHTEAVRVLLDESGSERAFPLEEIPDRMGNTPLMAASAAGRLGVVKLLLERGVMVESEAAGGFTALFAAATEGHTQVIQVLLEAGADTDHRSGQGWTPIMAAAAAGHADSVCLLLQFGASIHAQLSDDSTVLHLTAHGGHHQIVRMLIHHGVSVLQQNSEGFTALHLACMNSNMETVAAMVEATAERDGLGPAVELIAVAAHDGATPAMVATLCGYADIAQYLVSRAASSEAAAADYNPPSEKEEMTLLDAALTGDTVAVARLVGMGSDVNETTATGSSATHLAALAGHAQVARILVAAGADVLYRDPHGYTAFAHACVQTDMSVVVAMVNAVAMRDGEGRKMEMLEAETLDGSTPLLLAAQHDNAATLVYLLQEGASLLARSVGGYDALHDAVERGHTAIVCQLLAHGCDVNTRTDRGMTPLMAAAASGSEEIARLLVEAGAELDSRSYDHRSPLWFAAQKNHCAVAEYLLSSSQSIEIDVQDLDGATPLIVAESPAVVQLLLTHGARTDLAMDAPTAGTPLFHAAARGCAVTVKMLLTHGATVDVRGAKSLTPLMVAAARGHTAVCQLLIDHGANTTLRSAMAQTAMHHAAIGGHFDCVLLLYRCGLDPSARDKDKTSPIEYTAMAGRFDVVETLVAGTTAWQQRFHHPVWPLAALYEVYGVDIPPSVTQRVAPAWYIDRAAITVDQGQAPITLPAVTVSVGTWLGSRVDVVELLTATPLPADPRILFVQEVSRWSALHHPHVLKLFGACHNCHGKLYLVVEHTERGGLRAYVKQHPDKLWATLHQVALGLHYLHERGLLHENLHGDAIFIGDDGLPKLGYFGALQRSRDRSTHAIQWLAPEQIIVQGGHTASELTDVYALAMCMVEAVSGELPYAMELARGWDITRMISDGVLPARPSGFNDRAWELVERMTTTKSQRLPMVDVLLELEALASDEASSSAEAERSLVDRLEEVKHECERVKEPVDDPHLLARLSRLAVAGERRSSSVESQLGRIVDQYVDSLRLRVGATAASLVALTRKHAATVFSLHNELDRVVEQATGLPVETSTRAWRDAWHAWWHGSAMVVGVELDRILSREDSVPTADECERLTCLLFELTKHQSSYASLDPSTVQRACAKMTQLLPDRLPDWFLPWYEATIDPFPCAQGGYGAVYRGKWMSTDVIFKKLKPGVVQNDTAFIKEVSIWFQLHHPHVVRLYGACHVGTRVFVCESAAFGQLDRYLQQPGTRHSLWAKLHEAALGLQYLHDRGVVHCDIKCNNILIGRDHKAKLADFGLSWMATSGQRHGQRFNPHWAAPEVLRGGQPSQQSDIYSFGMSVMEAVTGRLPFGNEPNMDLLAARVCRDGFTLARAKEFESDAHWQLVLDCCHREPRSRASLDAIRCCLGRFASEDTGDGKTVTMDMIERSGQLPASGSSATASDSSSALSLASVGYMSRGADTIPSELCEASSVYYSARAASAKTVPVDGRVASARAS